MRSLSLNTLTFGAAVVLTVLSMTAFAGAVPVRSQRGGSFPFGDTLSHGRHGPSSTIVTSKGTKRTAYARSLSMDLGMNKKMSHGIIENSKNGYVDVELGGGRSQKGLTTLFSQPESVAIYVDSELTQVEGGNVVAVASLSQNGAPPEDLFGFKVVDKKVSRAWSQPDKAADTASSVGTTAALSCVPNADRTDTNCVVTAIDSDTGKVKWEHKFSSALAADHTAIAVTTDGAHIAALVTAFEAPLPSHSFHSQLMLFSTHTGTPVGVHNSKNLTQARDISVGSSHVGIVSQDSVEIFDIQKSSVEFSKDFDFSSGTFCISEDGSHFAYGFEQVFVYKKASTSFTYSQSAVLSQPSGGEIFLAGTCSIGGANLAVGWYADNTKQNLAELFDVDASKTKYVYKYPADVGSIYQNLPVSSAFTHDGSHFVIGSWGSSNQTSPTVAVFGTASDISHPIAEVTTIGSVYSVDIIRETRSGGIFITYSGKAVHANKMGDGGMFEILEVDHPTLVSSKLEAQEEEKNFNRKYRQEFQIIGR